MAKGTLYLIPNTLGSETTDQIIPKQVEEIATGLRFFAVEELKSARRLLRKMDRTFPIDDSQFSILTKKYYCTRVDSDHSFVERRK